MQSAPPPAPVAAANLSELDALLTTHGLQMYSEKFSKQDIDMALIRSLGRADLEEILKEVGLTIGHRTKFFQALGVPVSSRGVPVSTGGAPVVTPSPLSRSGSAGAAPGYSSSTGTPITCASGYSSSAGGPITGGYSSSAGIAAGGSRAAIVDYSSAYALAPAAKPVAFHFAAPAPVLALSFSPAAAHFSFAAPAIAPVSASGAGIDVCFVMDCTGSMGFWIEQTRTKIFDIIAEVHRAYPGLAIRIAFVGYRDRAEYTTSFLRLAYLLSKPPLEVFSFTTDAIAVRNFISRVDATGGGDAPEDVHKDLQQMWASEVRLLIHFADAPAHGRLYTTLTDEYPDYDVDGSIGKRLILDLAAKHVDYYFVEISSVHTKQMTDVFKSWYNTAPGRKSPLQLLPMTANPQEFVKGVVTAILTSVRASGRK